jgi:hypothetical protein
MKFFISILVVLFGLFQIITSKFKKNTRNYRKIASDPSYNPLPKSWESGSRNAFGGGHNLKKYKNYSSKLNHYHTYQDTTAQLRKVVNGQ